MSLNVNRIGFTTEAIYRTVTELKEEIKVKGKEMVDLTKKIEENTKRVEGPKKDWKYVHQPTESEQHPLAQSDISNIKKLLNVI